MDIRQLELHDAELLGVSMDARRGTVEVSLAWHHDMQSRERAFGTLRFAAVRRFNQLVDLDQLRNHARAGNVTQWLTGETPGISHIYLARGLIEIEAGSVEFVSS
ncbi:MAG: hypothetical protein ACM32J_17495 [Rhizobacter sp.]